MSRYEGIPAGRVMSVDALRGFDMFWIIGGSAVAEAICAFSGSPFAQGFARQFRHPEFLGFTALDVVFPLFLYVVGVSLSFSLSRRLSSGDSRRDIMVHVIKRTFVLYFLGMVMEAGRIDALGGLRYTGVLHRIAACYFLTSLIAVNTRIRGQAIWTAVLVVGYWLAMTLIPVPGHGAGVFTPEGNLSGYVDRLFLPGVLYRGVYDNEGILSTFPAVATTMLGVLSGHWLRSAALPARKAAGLCAGGASCLVLGLVWGTVFPVNKLMWTSSFVFVTGGISMLLLALFYWLIDVRGYRSWAFPFVVIGMNAIAIYFIQNVFDFGRIVLVFTHEFIDGFGMLRPLFWAVSLLAVKWLFVYILYRRRMFIKI